LTVITFFFDVIQEGNNKAFDEDGIGIVECLSSIGDEFADDSAVFFSAGVGVVLSEGYLPW